jgi:cytochrome c553
MQRMKEIGLCLVGIMLPIACMGASVAQQEFEEVIHRTPNIEHGAVLFQTCSKCHGPDGAGSRAVGTPEIAGQHFRVLVKQLVDYRHNRRWDFRMEPVAHQHVLADTQAIADLVGYVSDLEWKPAGGIGDGELVGHGQGVYVLRCQVCHGTAGEGDAEKFVPRLAGQHYGYLLREMHDAVEGRRPNFALQHIRLLQKLDRDDFVGLADFLSRANPARAGFRDSP